MPASAIRCYVVSPTFRTPQSLPLLAADMETGLVHLVRRWENPTGITTVAGLACDESTCLMTAHDGDGTGWYSVSPTDSTLTWLGDARDEGGAAWSGAEWIAVTTSRFLPMLGRYPSLGALAEDRPTALLSISGLASAFTADRDHLYLVGLGGHRVEVRAIETGALEAEIPLSGWEGALVGLSQVDRVLFLLSSPSGERFATISSFDLDGRTLIERAVVPGVGPGGLHCFRGGGVK